MNAFPVLTLLLVLPWLGALVIALSSGLGPRTRASLALLFSLTTVALVLPLAIAHASGAKALQEQAAWIATLNVTYHLSADGISLTLVLLTGLVAPLAILVSTPAQRNCRGYLAWFLALQGSAIGVFLARDFVLWFLFWELSLVPAFFLIRVWGGENRRAAAYQFFTYTMAGSALMLVAFAAIYASVGTLDFDTLTALAAKGGLRPALGCLAPWVFIGVLLGVGVKAPLFPLHSWLPATYVEAPTGTTLFLSGVLSKMGVFGFMRILAPLFPEQLHAAAPVLLGLAVGGALLGAFAALAQRDLKRMAAYCSLNHVSYCLMALFAAYLGAPSAASTQLALSGLTLQVFNHGLSAPALFLCVGLLEQGGNGVRTIDGFGGLRQKAPWLAGLFGVAVFASLGLPGLNGFVGEYLIFGGVAAHAGWAAAAAAPALLVTAIFLLRAYQAVFGGPIAGASVAFADIRGRDRVLLLGLALAMLVLGLAPGLISSISNADIVAWVKGMTP